MKYLQDIYVLQLTRFSQMLRNEGLSVGYRETMDAFEALQAVDIRDRAEFKAALRCLYAKSRAEQLSFDRLFDRFFVSAEMKRAFIEKTRAEAQEIAQRRLQAQEGLKVNGKSMDLGEELNETYVQMREEKREQLRRIMARNEENLQRSPELYANFIRSVFKRYLLEEQLAMEDAALNVEEKDPELALLFRDISLFQDFEIPKASELIAKIARQLNSELSRRKKSGGHRGCLDFKRTIRMGLQSGGSFNKLAFRKKRKQRRQLLILCDVSASMLQFSEFALRFIQSLSTVSEYSRIFLFSEDICEANAFSLQNMDKFREYVCSTGLYGKGTDLSVALDALRSMRPSVLSHSTTLIILSDTKTMRVARTVSALSEIKRAVGRVLWLNPIPERKWNYSKTIQIMAQLCPMLPCSTLTELSTACRKLMRA